MRFDSKAYKEEIEVVGQALSDSSYSIDDFDFNVEGDLNIKVLDKVRLLARLGDLLSSTEKETELGLELMDKYLNGKQVDFYRCGEHIGGIVYSSKTGLDAYPIFSQYPILVRVICSRLIGYVSKNTLGCMVRETATE